MALLDSKTVIRGLCRTCLAKEIELLSVFEERSGTITFDSIIASLTGIKIEHGDRLPTTICKDCKEKASSAYDFKIHAQQSEKTLSKILMNGYQEIFNNENLKIEPSLDDLNVKTEHLGSDSQDDYIDLDLSLAFVGPDECFDVDIVKDESNVKTENETLKEDLQKELDGEDIEKDNTYCPLCSTTFPDSEGLTEHAWQRHAELIGPKKRGRRKKLLTSTIINKLTENGYNLKVTSEPSHKCLFCNESFITKDDIILHMAEHRDEKIFSCMLCKKLYLKKKDFERHTCVQNSSLEDLKEGKPPDTRMEQRKHELYTEIKLHEILKKNGNQERSGLILACESCGGLFCSEDELSQHRDREHPELSVRCHICDKVFATLKSASRHRAACERIERQFACSSCELRFTHEVTLNKHILRSHTGQSVSLHFIDRDRDRTSLQYKCDTCSRRFTRKDLLERHSRSHKTGEKVFECDVCKKKFTRRDNLRAHMRIHEGKSTYADSAACLCLYCGRSFSNSSNLIVHMRRHTGEKPYKCDFCGKGFCRSSDLQCHRRSHTGEKPCVCRVCGKGFSRSNKLSRHMRVHTGVKPYKCSYCEKAFAQSNDLTVHVRRHTGDKPYVCELCGDRFIQGTALHAHRRTHGHYSTPPQVAAPADTTSTQIIYTIQSTTQTQ